MKREHKSYPWLTTCDSYRAVNACQKYLIKELESLSLEWTIGLFIMLHDHDYCQMAWCDVASTDSTKMNGLNVGGILWRLHHSYLLMRWEEMIDTAQ